MQTQTSAETKPIRLEDGSEGLVIVISDSDRFCITQNEAARACRSFDRNKESQKEWETQFSRFLADVRTWSKSHSDQIESSYVGVSGNHLNMIFVTKHERIDPKFNTLMATFEIALSKQYHWLRSDVMQIPRLYKDRLGSFATLVEVYADRTTTSATG